VVEGGLAQTNLPDECCDAVFMRHVYHHFGDPPAMNASLFRSLKPGGRLAWTSRPIPAAARRRDAEIKATCTSLRLRP
jgi:ubiquinone/menaquinone biosynthesis C-methylase UbiE